MASPYSWVTEKGEKLGYFIPFGRAFNANEDAEALNKAMVGLGTDNNRLIEILTTRNPDQVQAICKVYESKYGKTLIKAIEGDTSGSFENALVALCMTPAAFDAKELYSAMKGLGTRESSIIDILTTRSNAELTAIKQAYEQAYGKSLVDAIKGDTSGNFETGLLMLLQCNRDENTPVNPALAKTQAEALYKAGEKEFGTNSQAFFAILGKNSYAQNKAVSDAYAQFVSQTTLERAIEKEERGDVEKLLLAMLNPARAMAKRFKDAIKGVGTSENRLIAYSRRTNKLLLRAAKDEYFALYQEPLIKDIKNDLSGNFEKVIVAMLVTSEAETIAHQLQKAMAGLGTDTKTLMDIVGNPKLTKQDFTFISWGFQRDFRETLQHALKSEEGGNFGKLLVAITLPTAEYKAACLHDSMAGVGTDEKILIDMLVSSTSAEIDVIEKIYFDKYKKSLVQAIKDDTSGDLEKVLVKMVQEKRNLGLTINDAEAEKQAKILYDAGEGRMGTDEAVFMHVFTKYSPEDLALIDKAYEKKHGKSLIKAVEKECSGHFKTALIALFNPDAYAANLMFKAMKGVGTDDATLIRVVASRDVARMLKVGQIFKEIHKEDLKKMIMGDTSGNYRHLLLVMCGLALS